MKSISLSNLYSSVGRVSTEAVLNQLQIKNPALRKYLQECFQQGYGQGNGFLSDPLIECTFGWTSASHGHGENTMADLANQGLLSQRLVDVMDTAPVNPCKRDEDVKNGVKRFEYDKDIAEDEDARWPADRPPYSHQLEAWKLLSHSYPRSTVVTAGTGSGKSECFMVPMLNDMARQLDENGENLVGVQAIMLYPLNALINSQKDRLIGWTRGFEGKIKFALYNGETPEKRSLGTTSQQSWTGTPKPEELRDRESIRNSPPPVLVTNATMLEYMLVRPEDRPIIQKSKGKLRWIILDEAHTLVGSAAAETSLLLRRTMHAFGVKPKDVRIVATSATIGDTSRTEETDYKLRTFLADLGGVDIDQISVVRGHRYVPALPEHEAEPTNTSVNHLSSLSASEAYATLSQIGRMRSLRKKLAASPMTLSEIAAYLYPQSEQSPNREQLDATIRLIDIASDAFPEGDPQKDAYLPIRVHLFHRSQRGLWACVNPECSGKANSVLAHGWPFGVVHLNERQNCNYCKYPVFELTHCRKCNEPSLSAVRYITDEAVSRLRPRELTEIDEFSDEVENIDNVSSPELLPSSTDIGQRNEIVQVYTSQSEINDRFADVGGSILAWLQAPDGELSLTENGGVEIRYTIKHDQSGLRCACCNTVESEEGQIFKRAILGSPFLMGNIVPEMLRHIPASDVSSMKGRRLITFTDSRQGTARFSARLQLDAERRWTRSIVYRHLLRKLPEGLGRLDEEKQQAISVLEEQYREQPNPRVKDLIIREINELKDTNISKSTRVSWSDMVNVLASTDEIRLLSGAGDFSADQLAGEYAERDFDQPKQLARLFLLREFARRPLNSNNLESLGLVKTVYPELDKLTENDARDLNEVWFGLGFNFEQWRAFLKIFLDFYVRDETIVDLQPAEKNWMGARLYARLLQPQDFIYSDDEQIKKQQQAAYKVVPTAREKRPHRLVRMLELATKLTSAKEAGRFDEVLQKAFETLRELRILEYVKYTVTNEQGFQRSGFQLKMESMAFELIDKAYLCPLTQRWLDIPMTGPALSKTNGITPITTGALQLDDVLIKENPVPIPRPDKSMSELDAQSMSKLMNWLFEDEEIQSLRSEGLWRDLNDAAMKSPTLLRSREHSAQQGSSNLKQFEKAFKNDSLNVLNCSTTMEMGVDIGSLSMVAMNNAPPSTANYLQRAGRAGRRGQSTSVVLTFCKATPHGERIFADPRWPFSATPVPKVALDSSIIVSRHVNAYLLAQFLGQEFQKDNLTVSKAGDFFLRVYENSKCDLFQQWLSDVAIQDDALVSGLKTLVLGTSLESLSFASLIDKTRGSIAEVAKHWLNRHESLAQIIARADKKVEDDLDSRKVTDTAFRRLERQLKVMEREHLLGLMANRGFLPGYGFPTNVVELVTNNRSEKNESHERPNAYPSRSLEVAIREYEPGKDLVLNGQVYRSAGLQLSWKVPETKSEIPINQTMRYMVHCQCGFFSADKDSIDELPTSCPECSSKVDRMEYIVPTGFQVDYNAQLHNDYARPEYAEYKAPLVTIEDADWQALSKLDYGRFRATQTGHLFHYNDGRGAGYALCWHCGRTQTIETTLDASGEHIVSNEEKHRITQPHRQLQGTSKTGSRYCPTEPWSIKVGNIDKIKQTVTMPLVLGVPTTTTMLELQLRNPETHTWLDDRTLGTTLGTAIRLAFSSMEGLADSELGVAVQRRNSPDRTPTTSIFIYDKASQGAGYSMQLAEHLPAVLKAAYDFVKDCQAGCDKACHSCLLDFETQHQLSHLDRHAVVSYFDDTQLLERLSVEPDRQFFGAESRSELLNASSLLNLKGSRATEVDIFISGTDWDIANHPVLKKLKYLSNQSTRLLVAEQVAQSIDPELAWQFMRQLDADVSLHTYRHPNELARSTFPLMRLRLDRKESWYASDDEKVISLNKDWGTTEQKSLITCENKAIDLVTEPLDLSEKSTQSALATHIGLIEDFNSVNGPIQNFGSAFVDLMQKTSPLLHQVFSDKIARLSYRDRYLKSPITIALVAEIYRELAARYGVEKAEIETSPTEINHRHAPSCFADDFETEADWQNFISGISSTIGVKISSKFRQKRDLPHGREMTIYMESGSIYRLLFDQGMGHWGYRTNYRHYSFNFNFPREEGKNYRNSPIRVKGGSGATYVVIHQVTDGSL